MRSANLALSFLLELCGPGALAFWGWQSTDDPVIKVVLAVGAPLVMVVVWGVFVAPKAPVRVPPVPKAILSLLILELTAAALIASGQQRLGIAFAVLILVNAALAAWWRQHPS
jgi:hypothetical protein